MLSIGGLISLAILAIIVGFVAWIIITLIERIPMDATFQQIARGCIILVAVLIILMRLLPLLGVHI